MQLHTVRIYCTENVPRLRYIARVLLEEILGLSYEIITDKRKLRKHLVINYSAEYIPGSFKIFPDKLLFEKGVIAREISVSRWNNLPVLFPVSEESDLPFDVFAASFYLISRYEEYLNFKPDEHGRFKASSSLAYRHEFLNIPVVDLWAREMSKAFLKKFPTLTFRRNEYKSLVTIDIDQAFAFPRWNILSSISGFISEMAGNMHQSSAKNADVAQEVDESHDVFGYITEKISDYKQNARFFFPVGDHSDFDLNPAWKNPEYRDIIIAISRNYETGIHPSYYSSGKASVFLNELNRLNTITGQVATINRYHYLKYTFPESYRRLLSAGIQEDYSMGYPDETGFRAGIARPYFFYDVLKDELTNLKIVPFQFMDETLIEYKGADPESARRIINKLINETKRVGGLFVSIWHNTTLIEERKDWRNVFEQMLKEQNNDNLS